MDEAFWPAALAIAAGFLRAHAELLDAEASLATRTSSTSHPTLLQFVACDAAKIINPVGSASRGLRSMRPSTGPTSQWPADSSTVELPSGH